MARARALFACDGCLDSFGPISVDRTFLHYSFHEHFILHTSIQIPVCDRQNCQEQGQLNTATRTHSGVAGRTGELRALKYRRGSG